jgi:hypothetical protein
LVDFRADYLSVVTSATPPGADDAIDVPPAATARRLSNQIARAFRGTYGARTGLRTIVRLTTQQMLLAGNSPDTIRRTLESCVLNHPARVLNDPQNIVTGETQSATLAQLTRKWSDEVLAVANVD